MAKNPYKGVPDILVCAPGGKAVWMEVKTDIGRLSPDQISFKDRVEQVGCDFYIVRSVSDVAAIIKNVVLPPKNLRLFEDMRQ